MGGKIRSGGADGIDHRFIRGAMAYKDEGCVEVYLPFETFGPRQFPKEAVVLAEPSSEARKIAKAQSIDWARIGDEAKQMRARDVHLLLGANLHDPAVALCYWFAPGEQPWIIDLAGLYKIPMYDLAQRGIVAFRDYMAIWAKSRY